MMIDKKQKTLKKKSPKKILPNGVPSTNSEDNSKKRRKLSKKRNSFSQKKIPKNLSKNNKSILPNEIQINK